MFDEAPRPETPFHEIHETGCCALAEEASDGLRFRSPEHSAYGVLSAPQHIIFIGAALFLILSALLFPTFAFIALNAAFASYFLIAAGFRVALMWMGRRNTIARISPALGESDLPTITILAPLYQDAASLASLARAIDALAYPASKKDVKLLLEEDDPETLAEARRLGLIGRYDTIVIPDIGPRTKPKACNVGLHKARGELIVIYDAEDQPERDQLLKAAAHFSLADEKLACLQARLNYYNASENWLTRLFTLEYALWFDWLLPALQRLRAPIPLGGTSNIFRIDILRAIGGWDPYNVTEDADLGLRLSRLGYRVEMLNSTTFEEANCRTGNWVRQRSRWIKGHLQTWLVHMRRPGEVVSTTGWFGFLSIQLLLAGNVVSALINPFLWAAFVLLKFDAAPFPAHAIPESLVGLNFAALVIGNCCFIITAAVAPLKRGWRHLCLYGFTAPLYWLLSSAAAYKALWQIFACPYYWEKTDHVISEAALKRREDALKALKTA